MTLLNFQQRESFAEHGYAILRGVLPPGALGNVIESIERAVDRRVRKLKDDGRIFHTYDQEPFEHRWQRVMEQLDEEQPRRSWDDEVISPQLFDLMRHPDLLDIIESLVGPEIYATGIIAVRPKIPHDKRTTVLWHQDSNYLGEDSVGHQIMTMWLPLIKTDEQNGCMQVIPGSHRWGYQSAEMDPEYKAYRSLNDPTERGQPLVCPMDVGDVLVFNNLLVHRSGMNCSDHIRWSVDLRYYATDVTFQQARTYLPGFVARSKASPESVASWESWRKKVEAFQAVTN